MFFFPFLYNPAFLCTNYQTFSCSYLPSHKADESSRFKFYQFSRVFWGWIVNNFCWCREATSPKFLAIPGFSLHSMLHFFIHTSMSTFSWFHLIPPQYCHIFSILFDLYPSLQEPEMAFHIQDEISFLFQALSHWIHHLLFLNKLQHLIIFNWIFLYGTCVVILYWIGLDRLKKFKQLWDCKAHQDVCSGEPPGTDNHHQTLGLSLSRLSTSGDDLIPQFTNNLALSL